MKKMIIMAAVAFVVALGGSTALRVMTAKAPPKPAVQAGAEADSSGALAQEDTTHAVPAGEPVESPGAGESVEEKLPGVEPQGSGHLTTVSEAARIETSTTAPELSAESAPPASAPVDYAVLSKILGNMKAAESAQILLHLSDEQAEGVLRGMNPRLAAQILAKIPPDRAGTLSQMLLVPRGDKP